MIKSLLKLSLVYFFLSQTAFSFINIEGQRHRSKHNHVPIHHQVLRPDTYKAQVRRSFAASYKVTSIKRDTLTNAIRLISGDFGHVQKTHTTVEHYKEFALNFIDQNFEIFGIKAKDLKIIPQATYTGKDVQFIQFALFKDEKLIEDSSVSFRFKRNKLVQITNFTFSEARLVNKPLLSQDLLENTLLQETGAKRLTKTHDTYRVMKEKNGYTLIPVANYEVLDRDNISLSVQINQSNNKIYEQKENKLYIQGHASMDVYPRWYKDELTTADAPLLYLKKNQAPSTL